MLFLYTALFFSCNRSNTDNDHDGWSKKDDCNDNNPAIHPMASEICDGVDNDCDRKIDDDDELGVEGNYVLYLDLDNDGYGDITSALGFCAEPSEQEEYITIAGDCDDTNPDIGPGATEVP